MLAATYMATRIFLANLCIASVRLKPPALCPTSITCAQQSKHPSKPNQNVGLLMIDRKYKGNHCSQLVYLFIVRQIRQEVGKGRVVFIKSEDCVGIGLVNTSTFKVETSNLIARCFHETPDLEPAPSPVACSMNKNEVQIWNSCLLFHFRPTSPHWKRTSLASYSLGVLEDSLTSFTFDFFNTLFL